MAKSLLTKNRKMYEQFLEKALLQGAMTSGFGFYFYGNSLVQIPFSNVTLPLYLFTFTVGAISIALTDVTHTLLTKNGRLDNKVLDLTTLGIGSIINGMLFYGGLYLAGGGLASQYGYSRAMITGCGSELLSSGLYYALKNKMYYYK